MKTQIISIFVITLMAFAISCNNGSTINKTSSDSTSVAKDVKSGTSSLPDYSGVYKSNEKGCGFTISLTKENEVYKFTFKGEGIDASGIATFEKTDAVYITFDGKIGENEPKSVSGQVNDSSIIIQNYGNAMNQFLFFKSCDLKYMEFLKQ